MQRCYGCMREFGKQYEVCPHCGYIVGTEPESKSHLVPGMKLAGRYVLGKALGHGGFGITYIAWDSKINKTVSIKEYFPCAFSTRSAGETQISCFNSKAEKFLRQGIEKMLDEARRVSKFSKNENIVDIYDFFEENNTAYIVMEYLEGRDLKKYLEENSGKLSADKAVELILPVLNALEEMHKENIIHRDISPDNIFLCDNGKVKLLDFGSARLAVEDSDKSLSVMIKRGYAPREQYASRTKQGPWTDVYAVCATLYKLITGELPTESTERDEEPLKKFSEFGIKDCSDLEKVIFKGMEINYTDRIQNVQELRSVLVKTMQKKATPVVAEVPKKQDITPKAEKPEKPAISPSADKPVVPQKPQPAKAFDTPKQSEKKSVVDFSVKMLFISAGIVFVVGLVLGIKSLNPKTATSEAGENASSISATTEVVIFASEENTTVKETQKAEKITQTETTVVDRIIETVTKIVYTEKENPPKQEPLTEKMTEKGTEPVVTEAITIPAVKWEKAVDSGYCGSSLTWTLYEDGELIIKGNGYMYDWFMSTTPSPWYNHDIGVKSVIIGKGVKSIGDSAFFWCGSLERVVFESGSQLEIIGENAFANCNNLRSIVIPDTVIDIENYAFSQCQKLESIAIPESVTEIKTQTFAYCYKLKRVTIPASVKKIGSSVFFLCNDLKDIYYGGTQEQWNKITIVDENDSWKDTVTIHYSS